ncbi:hypothetical protein REPUB_Repub13aG0164900 [Reevesia pubescens]
MAVSAKTPRTLINHDLPNPIHTETQSPKSLYISNQRQTLKIFSTQPHQQLSVLNNTTSLNTHDPNSHLHLICLNGHLQQALNYLNSMQELQIPLDEDAAIAMWVCKKGFFDEALCLYHGMLWVGFKPDVYTFPCVLRTCDAVPNLERGKEVHVHVIRFGFEADVDVVNALVTMYVKCWDLRRARLLFDKMTRRDRISWNAIISGHFENGECLEGIKLFFTMREHWVDPDLMTMTRMSDDVSVCNSLIQMYSSLGHWETAEKVFDRMEWRDMELLGFIPDEITLASVLSALACLGKSVMGIKLHELAKRAGLISYIIVANTMGGLMCGKEIHAYALRTGVGLDGFLPNALLDMYVRCGRMGPAWNQFNSKKKDVVAWNILLTGYSQRGQGKLAVEFFDRMFDSYVNPDEITFIPLFCACSKSGMVDLGEFAAQCIFESDTRSVGWVKVRGKIHAFLSGDDFHPQIKEINAVLEGIYEKMKVAGLGGPKCDSMDEVEISKAEIFCWHSERLAVVFGLIILSLECLFRRFLLGILKNSTCSRMSSVLVVMWKY